MGVPTRALALDGFAGRVALADASDVPMPVHAAYVSKCDADSQSAEISFEHMEPADTVSPVKEFWVQYQMDSETEGTQWRTHPVPVQAHPNDRIEGDQRMVSGKATVALQPFGHYVFRVLARNGVGDSSPTRVKDVCITPPKQPDRNPSGVWAKGASPENIVVHWRPMSREEWNGKNFHYKIKYRPSEGGDGEWKEVQVNDPFADRYTITLEDDKDVKPFQPYEVQVTNGAHEGEPSEVIQFRTAEGAFGIPQPRGVSKMFFFVVPSPVRGLRAHPMNPKEAEEKAVVHLIWRRPRRPNGKLLKYVERRPVGNTFLVEYREADTDEWKRVPQKGDDLTVQVGDLNPGTRYEVRVAALQKDPSGTERESYSPSSYITTTGRDDDEKRSLTGSKAESETDSMAEYGDTDPGRFTEDGSFIGTNSFIQFSHNFLYANVC
ncbi:fibronectin type III domain protein [Teladorsagia circumcincta]|uniref:Fibronectin type III domain protein n=1 Tax=Teladorsagia circumcincta TaxID=45464 RepID=A0A2G9U5G2_TELCI|nr:fibronectin type III domain protein [Teladorsagia circumcincta]